MEEEIDFSNKEQILKYFDSYRKTDQFYELSDELRNDPEVAYEAVKWKSALRPLLGPDLKKLVGGGDAAEVLGRLLGRDEHVGLREVATEHARLDEEAEQYRDGLRRAIKPGVYLTDGSNPKGRKMDDTMAYDRFISEMGVGRPDQHQVILGCICNAHSTNADSYKKAIKQVEDINQNRANLPFHVRRVQEEKEVPEFIPTDPSIAKAISVHGMTAESVGDLSKYPEDFRKEINSALLYNKLGQTMKHKAEAPSQVRKLKI